MGGKEIGEKKWSTFGILLQTNKGKKSHTTNNQKDFDMLLKNEKEKMLVI